MSAEPARRTPRKQKETVPGKRIPRKPGQRAVRPRLAATLVVLAGDISDPYVLMGRRTAAQDFMPGVHVFPGGRVERADSFAPFSGELSLRTRRILEAAMKPRRARACVLAGIRETWEETGLRISTPVTTKMMPLRNALWGDFVTDAEGANHLPALSGIEVMGRATTPPTRHKRFDTWFFVKHLGEAVPQVELRDSDELENVGWHSLSAVAELETHRITDAMLDVLRRWLDGEREDSVPFHRMLRGAFVTGRFPKDGAGE